MIEGSVVRAGERVRITAQLIDARALLDQLKSAGSHRYVTPYASAVIHLGLGEKDRALDDLERTYEVRSQMLASAKIDRIFDSVRSEPRFIELMKKVHLEQ